MDPETDRITQIEESVALLHKAGYHNTLGGIATCNNMDANKAAIALNTATIESFERTIADMQEKIDELMGKESDE